MMKLIRYAIYGFAIVVLLIAVLGERMEAQKSNTFQVDQQPGNTVAEKTAAAQSHCRSDIPCVLIFDPILAAFSSGSMPSQGSNEIWQDYRVGNKTIPSSAAGSVNGLAITPKKVNEVRDCNQYCAVANTFDETCIQGCYNDLPSTGGEMRACGLYSISNPILFTDAKHSVVLSGCGKAGTASGTRLVPANGTVTPIISIVGTDTSHLAEDYKLQNFAIGYGTYASAQHGLLLNKFVNVQLDHVGFQAMGQAIDADYGFRFELSNPYFSSCGSGTTGATACVRLENRTNPSVNSEQFIFHSPLFEGDTSTFTRNGIGLYIGPATFQVILDGFVKFDYSNSGTTAPVLSIFQSSHVSIYSPQVSAGGAHPSTASTEIDIGGTSGTKSTDISIFGGEVDFVDAQKGFNIDYAQNLRIVGVNFQGNGGSHTGTAVNWTANASGTQILTGFTMASADTPYADASVNGAVILGACPTALGSFCVKSLPVPSLIGSGAKALTTGSLAANTCFAADTVSVSGVLTTDRISWLPNADISAAVGYGKDGTLRIYAYPTANTVNFKVCNSDPTNAVTVPALTLNWSVPR
jgi:hypothetical protein